MVSYNFTNPDQKVIVGILNGYTNFENISNLAVLPSVDEQKFNCLKTVCDSLPSGALTYLRSILPSSIISFGEMSRLCMGTYEDCPWVEHEIIPIPCKVLPPKVHMS